MGWKTQIDVGHPCWTDFETLIDRLPGHSFPSTRDLNTLLDKGANNSNAKPISFRSSRDLPGVDYEAHIFATGEVSTRENNWHDLCNALVWSRLTAIKSSFNALHQRGMSQSGPIGRGPLRDALTLLDESGALVVSASDLLLSALAARDWQRAFVDLATHWEQQTLTMVCGHALLEKFQSPYKSMTAHCLLLRAPHGWIGEPRVSLLERIDLRLADALLAGQILTGNAHLSPVPLMGIPGWWPNGPQDDTFYADTGVFRPAPAHRRPAPVFDL